MPLAIFEKTLTALREEGFRIGMIEYCGQGDPLMHPRFRECTELARRIYPETKQRLVTNGNFDYGKTCGTADLDEIVVSCDGFFQANYERYRVGGNVGTVLQFLKDAAEAACASRRRTEVVWKYIVFEWNDSDEELIAAQRFAETLPIEKLQFIFTHSLGKSARLMPERPFAVPVISQKVEFHNTCHLDLILDYGKISASNLDPACIDSTSFFAWLEEASVFKKELFRVKGWIASRSYPIERLDVFLDRRLLGTVTKFQWRNDVFKVFPQFHEQNTHFRLLADARDLALESGEHALALVPYSGGRALGECRQHVLMHSAGATNTTVRYASMAPADYEQRLLSPGGLTGRLGRIPRLGSMIRRARWGHFLLTSAFATKVEEISVFHDRHLKLRGWALARRAPVSRVDVSLNGTPIGSATDLGFREDVLRIWPTFPRQRAAFQLEAELDHSEVFDQRQNIGLTVFADGRRVGFQQQEFRLDLSPEQFLLRQ